MEVIIYLFIFLIFPITIPEIKSQCDSGRKRVSKGCSRFYDQCMDGTFVTLSCPESHKFSLPFNKCVPCPERRIVERPKRKNEKYYVHEKFRVEGKPQGTFYYFNPNGSSFTFTAYGHASPRPANEMVKWLEDNRHNYYVTDIDYIDPKYKTTTTSTRAPPTTTTTEAPPSTTTEYYMNRITEGRAVTWEHILPRRGCGIFGDELKTVLHSGNRVSNGMPTQIEYNPWQVAIVDKSKNLQCGGSIIADRFVLTARHCFLTSDRPPKEVRKNDRSVVGGSTNYREMKFEFFILQLFNNEDFDDSHKQNDISLLMIDGHFNWSTTTYPICLPAANEEYNQGRSCRVSGWGDISFKQSAPDNVLRFGNLKITSYEECSRNNGKKYKITDSMFCASGILNEAIVDTCSGDSGGPLVSYSKPLQRYVLLGITSFGINCSEVGYPGVYTKVSSFLQWIRDRVEFSVGARETISGRSRFRSTTVSSIVTEELEDYSDMIPDTGPVIAINSMPANVRTWKDELPETDCGMAGIQLSIFLGLNNKIVGGQSTTIKENPWQVAILNSAPLSLICGGVIIGERFVLTAAHCGPFHSHLIYAGATNYWDAPVIQEIAKVFTDENYVKNGPNDIALLKTKEPFLFTENIFPVCLPKIYEKYKTNRPGRVSGWGVTQLGGSTETKLNEGYVSIHNIKLCKAMYKESINYDLGPGMFCAMNSINNTDTCSGDSGGPLVSKSPDTGRYVLLGITSFGIRCGETFPGVYTKINMYLRWIHDCIDFSYGATKTISDINVGLLV